MTNIKNPWAGLSSYQEGDGRLFCGRDNESFDVARLVDNNIFVTLYGKSGIGKTSLMNAGVFPRLRQQGYFPVSIRLGLEAVGMSLQSCIVSRLEAVISEQGTIIETDIVSLPDKEDDEIWLWSFFARKRFLDGAGHILFPVLVFDQYEEVLRTRAREAGILMRQIHFMMDESHALPDTDNYSYDYNFRFLVSIREDELYRLEDCQDENYLADMKRCRYRLRGLTDQGLSEVVLVPGHAYIEEGHKESLVQAIASVARNQSDGTLSTNILSLVCSRAFDEMLAEGRTTIDSSLVAQMVSDNLFEKYYLEAMEGFPRKASEYIEDHLVDSADRRNSVTESDFFRAIPGGEVLIQEGPRKILQRFSVASGSNQTRIELVHDSFCEPVARLRKKRQQKKKVFLSGIFASAALLILGISAIIIHDLRRREWKMLENQSRFVAEMSVRLSEEGDYRQAKRLVAAILPKDLNHPKDRPYIPRAGYALLLASENDGGLLKGDYRGRVKAIDGQGNRVLAFLNDLDIVAVVWDATTGEELCTIKEPCENDSVCSAALSPDGSVVALGSANGFVIFVDAESGNRMGQYRIGRLPVMSLQFNPDGRSFAAFSYDGVMLYDRDSGSPIGSFDCPDATAGSFTFSPDGKKILVASNTMLASWVIETGEPCFSVSLSGGNRQLSMINTLVFSPDGNYFLTNYGSKQIGIWSADSGELMRVIDGTQSITPSSSVISTLVRGALGNMLNNKNRSVIGSFDISPDGGSIAVGFMNGSVGIWDMETGKERRVLSSLKQLDGQMRPSIMCLAYGADGKYVFAGLSNGKVHLWDAGADNHVIGVVGTTKSIALAPEGKRLAIGRLLGEPLILNVETKKVQHVLSSNLSDVYAISFDTDGQKVMAATWDQKMYVWDPETEMLLDSIAVRDGLFPVSCAACPDGEMFIVGFMDGEYGIWDLKARTLEYYDIFGKEKNSIVAVSSDGRCMACIHNNGRIQIRRGDKTRTLQLQGALGGEPSSYAVSPEGRQIALGYEDGSIRIWSGENGQLLLVLDGGDKYTGALAYGPEGKTLISVNADKVRLWNLDLEGQLESIRKTLPPLSPEERVEYYIE